MPLLLIGGHPGGFNPLAHSGSVREMTNSSGVIQGQLSYDPFGRATQLQGTLSPDFQYASYYMHAPSGLSIALNREYSSTLGRWLSRDPMEEEAGNNLYAYVMNNPISYSDPLGLQMGFHYGNWTGQGFSNGTFAGGGENGDYMPMMPGDPGFVDPKNCIDSCSMLHDICMHIGHSIQDKKKRKCWNRDCHKAASQCYANCGGAFGTFLSGLFGGLSHVGGAGAFNPNISFPSQGAPPPGGSPPGLH